MQVAVGFDGSDSDDWTAIRAETRDGWMFTPTYGPDRRPTIWNPQDWGGRIPRLEVHAAVHEIFRVFRVRRMYCDPREWQTEIETWALRYGDEIVTEWSTFRAVPMHAALVRFKTDLGAVREDDAGERVLTHDDCPITKQHMANARKYAATKGERFIIGKPAGAYHQKIDATVASVICHEAACDARAAGWPDEDEVLDYELAGI